MEDQKPPLPQAPKFRPPLRAPRLPRFLMQQQAFQDRFVGGSPLLSDAYGQQGQGNQMRGLPTYEGMQNSMPMPWFGQGDMGMMDDRYGMGQGMGMNRFLGSMGQRPPREMPNRMPPQEAPGRMPPNSMPFTPAPITTPGMPSGDMNRPRLDVRDFMSMYR